VPELGGGPPTGNACAGLGPTVWSDTQPDGTLEHALCGDWTDPIATGVNFGDATLSNSGWTSVCGGSQSCGSVTAAIYCFEQ
jgi:hypothetical protein